MKILWMCLILLCSSLLGKETTTVQSQNANYDGKEILLEGGVLVENSLGSVTAEIARLIKDETHKSSIDFPQVELKGNVNALLFNGSSLRCHILFLDYNLLSGVFSGLEQNQVLYCDTMGEIYADKAEVKYALIDGSYKPVKVMLIDNVQLINRSSFTKGKQETTLQYALADYVEYYPLEESMLLKGKEGKRVLFFDQMKDMQLSAKTVKGKRNGKTGAESIQGMGDVRFTFGQEELEKLKKHFDIP